MRRPHFNTARVLVVFLAGCFGWGGQSFAQNPTNVSSVQVSGFDRQVRTFLQNEVSAHVADIKTLDPPPDRVVGALTTGEFSWGSFMRALGAYSELFGTRSIVGRDIPQMLGAMAGIEVRQNGKTWTQLYAAMALRSFGANLEGNVLWRSMTPEERNTYRSLLDPARFYIEKTHALINLPENYFGVAARIAAIDYQLGIIKDRTALDDLLSRAAKQFTDGALFADDALPTGSYDRYSNEYARAIYEAGEIAGRQDIVAAVAPSLKVQMKLWWDLLSEDGYGYSWGRSLGAISYMDTLEIVGFLAAHPEFRPAPLSQLAAAYFAAWSWLRDDFNGTSHLLRVFAFGRGNYSYITKEREWQQTTTFFGKVISAHRRFIEALEKEGVQSFPSRPSFSDVARFQFFRDQPGRKYGVWIVRRGGLHFVLPFVTGPKAATSDYQPVPDGFPGIAVPVEKIYPCFVPFLQLEDGRTIAALDGADEIKPSPDGDSVTAVWRRWVVVGAAPGELVDAGLVSEVTWNVERGRLRRVESLTASQHLRVRRLWLAIPSRYDHLETSYAQDTRIDKLVSEGKTLEVAVHFENLQSAPEISAFASGNDPLGRGDRGPLPIHLLLQTKGLSLVPGIPWRWDVVLSAY